MKRSMILSLIAVISCITVPSALAGTWRDDFGGKDFHRWEVVMPGPEEKWEVEDGECSGQWANAPADFASVLELRAENAAAWKDYIVECRARLIEKLGAVPGFGIYFRGIIHYGIDINLAEEKVFFWVVDGQGKVAEAPLPFDIIEDTWYELKLIAEGDHFEFYINHEFIGSFNDGSHPSGSVQLMVTSAHVHFDDVVITGPEIPDRGPGIWVRKKDRLVTTWGIIKQERPETE